MSLPISEGSGGQQTCRVKPGGLWQPWGGDEVGLGTLRPAQHELMPTLLLQGTDGVPGLRGQLGQEGPGVSPQEWVGGCGVLSSTPLQLPKALQGNANPTVAAATLQS